MACFHPLPVKQVGFTASGKKAFKFIKGGYSSAFYVLGRDNFDLLPCGQCVGCRLERSRQWAMRCMHEAQLHDRNCFITLTYDSEHLPENNSLSLSDWQNFMKRLRKKYGNGIKFFHCGEYGPVQGRPHDHACIFGHDFSDRVYLKTTKSGERLYRSKSLEQLWEFGFSSVGDVTFNSAAYVARYIMKKVNGKLADEIGDDGLKHYEVMSDDGEIIEIRPEYTTMSRRPGIGSKWFDLHHERVYSSDSVRVKGIEVPPPKFYDSKYELLYPDSYVTIKNQRKDKAILTLDDNTPRRLADKKKVLTAKLALFNRSVE